MPILVFVEQTEGKFKKSAIEAVSFAFALGSQLGEKVNILSIGKVENSALESFGKYGAEKAYSVDQESLNGFVNQAYASIISKLAKKLGSKIVILSNSFSAKGMAPRIAIKLNASLGEAVMDLPVFENDDLIVKRSVFSGKAFCYERLVSEVKVLSLSPNSFPILENPRSCMVEVFQPEMDHQDFGTMIQSILRNTDKISLPDAERVVSAGRGLKGPENWKMIEDLAEVLGAATACSKPVSDAGWRPHSEHVGQTGISISPNLYIAIGISGAIQHLAGVSSSKVIVVINKDPDAPFFKVADYGIIGDAFEIVPKLIQAAQSLKA